MANLNSFTAPVDFRLSQTPPDGIEDPAVKAGFDEVYNSFQQVFRTFVDYCGIGPQPSDSWAQLAGNPSTLLASNLNRFYVIADEPITQGAAISIVNVAGAAHAVNANATNNTKPCRGFSNGPTVSTGEVFEAILGQGITNISGLVPGNSYYLSTSNGLISSGPAVGAGNIEQYLGFAVTDTTLVFNVGYWIQH